MSSPRTLSLPLALAILSLACEAPPTLGAACTRASECGSPLVCEFSRCRSQCEENRDCPVGATCLPVGGAGVCSVEIDLGCETGVGRMCPSGLTCVADRCLATCAMDEECPSDGECRATAVPAVSFCFDPRLPVPDGGLLDAGPRDGSQDDAGTSRECTSVCIESNDLAERTCAVCDGRVLCWGHDADDGLGDGPGQSVTAGVPVAVVDGESIPLAGFRQVACGYDHACALGVDGDVYCWGVDAGGRGTLGAAGTTPVAVRMELAAPADAIVAGQYHTCARLRDTAEVYCWGANAQGQVDPSPSGAYALEATTEPVDADWRAEPPTRPFDATSFDLARAARHRTCVVELGAMPTMRCIGLGEFAVTGVVSDAPVTALGTSIVLPTGTTDVALGTAHTCVLAAGSVSCMGGQNFGALGAEPPSTCDLLGCSAMPRPIDGVTGIVFDHVGSGSGSDHTCASVASPGTGLHCWGRSEAGQCGATSESVPIARAVDSMSGRRVTVIATSYTSTCAIADGFVYCWGSNAYGQLGRGDADVNPHPVAAVVTIPSL